MVNKGPSANRLASWRGGRNYVLPMLSGKPARPPSTLFCSNIEFEQYVLSEDTDPLKSYCAVETPTVESWRWAIFFVTLKDSDMGRYMPFCTLVQAHSVASIAFNPAASECNGFCHITHIIRVRTALAT